LPDPDGPTNPTVSPRATSNVMPRKISTGPALPASVNATSRMASIVSVILSALWSCLALGYGARHTIRNCTIALIVCTLPANAEKLTLVALGDSLTQGFGLPQQDGFVPQLQSWLTQNGADVTVINAGVSGDTTAGGLARLDWTLTPDVDAMIVNLGGNDLLRGIDPASSRANLDTILTKTKSLNLPVLLVSLRAPGNYGPKFKTDFDAMYPDLAQKHNTDLTENFFIPLIDQSTRRLSTDLMQPDGLHPNAKGVQLLVASIGPKVLKLLEKVKQ
jgi:acyl-CoA thioesterase I